MMIASERLFEIGRQMRMTTDEKELEKLREERDKETNRVIEEWRKDPFLRTLTCP